ncbi:MAG: hypothetical protein J0L86_05425 [Flavobacteriales bacterium]|nr:hypothetical protein [Flavobacteriales bacterium]
MMISKEILYKTVATPSYRSKKMAVTVFEIALAILPSFYQTIETSGKSKTPTLRDLRQQFSSKA